MPRHEGNKMKGGVRPRVRLIVTALVVAGALASLLDPAPVFAQPAADRLPASRLSQHTRNGAKPYRHPRGSVVVPPQPASDLAMRTAVPPDLDQRRRDGHMTPDERRLLRQHIEDAVRELYKR